MYIRKALFVNAALLISGIFLVTGCAEEQDASATITSGKTVVRTVTRTRTATTSTAAPAATPTPAPAPAPAPARTPTPSSSGDVQAADYDSMLYVVQTHPDYNEAASYEVTFYDPAGFGNVEAYYPEIDGTIIAVYLQKDPGGYWYVVGDSMQDIP